MSQVLALASIGAALKVLGGANSEPGIDSRFSSPSPARVIVVDYDQPYAETLTLELSERGFSVRHFAGAEALLAALDEVADADITLLDWHMPKVSGMDLLSALRRRSTPVQFGHYRFARDKAGRSQFANRHSKGRLNRLTLQDCLGWLPY